MKTSVFPGRYVQGPGVLARLGEETLRLGTLALALMDDTLPGPIARAVAGGGGCVRRRGARAILRGGVSADVGDRSMPNLS